MGALLDRVAGWRAAEAGLRRRMAAPKGGVHLVGIGGVGMAGLALHLQARGFYVTGSDARESSITAWLRRHGVSVQAGHEAGTFPDAARWVVKTPAVGEENPEVVEAIRRQLPLYTRGQVLPVLLRGALSVAVCGTHGKTTTAAMLAHILQAAGHDPSFLVGGEVDETGAVAGVGDGGIMVAEADESDGTLALYQPEITVLTGIEFDHMENFDGPEEFTDCFRQVVAATRERLIYWADSPGARSVVSRGPTAISFGLDRGADVRADRVHSRGRTVRFDVYHKEDVLGSVQLPVAGEHNVRNALAVLAAGMTLGMAFDDMCRGLATFRTVRRRFEWLRDDDNLAVVSDYAHHPSEIRAAVAVARGQGRRVVALFQPHRYSRTRALGPDFPPAFAGVDRLVLAPVYAASEAPLSGGSSRDLLEHFHAQGMEEVILASNLEEARDIIWSLLRPGDMLLVAGAGDVDSVAHQAANWSE